MAKRPTPIVRDADVLLRRGIEAVEFDRIDEAVGCCARPPSSRPDSHDVQLVFGIALMRALEMQAAIAVLETAIALSPRSFFAHFRMGEAYMRVGVPTRAKEYLDRAMLFERQQGTARYGSDPVVGRGQARRQTRVATGFRQADRAREVEAMTMLRNRAQILTLGAAAIAAIMMVFFFKAPILPVIIGAIGTAYFIIRRKPEV